MGGNEDLVKRYGALVVGFAGDRGRLPGQSVFLEDNEIFMLGQSRGKRVLHVPGHTLGHVAYFLRRRVCLLQEIRSFTWAVGAFFEGTPEQMWESLMRLAALPQDTRVFCGHEYILSNLAFARHVWPNDVALPELAREFEQARAKREALVGLPLSFEMRFNPFLRCLQDAARQGACAFHAAPPGKRRVFKVLRLV